MIWKLRLPRILAAALLGGALSVSGFLTRRPSLPTPSPAPFVLGISSGAKLTVSLAMVGLALRGGGDELRRDDPGRLSRGHAVHGLCAAPVQVGCTRCPCWW
ncbi:MAG: iron chelate uptake ABC transporter family permease subunit [Lawsonibacter sp.]